MLKSTSFIFDDELSENYGVMIYFMEDSDTRELELGTNIDVIEDRLPKRTTPIHYGVDVNKPMSFPLTFGSTEYLTDSDVDAILSWLTGHQQYKWLEYVDGDHYVRYKCHLNNMQSVYINGLPTAFTCDVECDGQFAYEYPIEEEYMVDADGIDVGFFNKSSYNGYLYPSLKLEFANDCNTFSIVNNSDNMREFKVNYFDRTIDEDIIEDITYNTTIANETNIISENDDFMSWQICGFDNGEYGDIISGNDLLIALPVNGNVALYTDDGGETWQETVLPVIGKWVGCHGNSGFIALCTNEEGAVTAYSQTGKIWSEETVQLPVAQDWTKVTYVETKGFTSNYYIAIAENSSIIAASISGRAWTQQLLPYSQSWQGIVTGNGKVLLVGGNSNIAVISTDCIKWRTIELPKDAAWKTGGYVAGKYLLLGDTLYGSGSLETVALSSIDGENWEVIEFPIGNWSSFISDNNFLAVGDRKFAYSLDGENWKIGDLPLNVTAVVPYFDQFICVTGTNRYIISNAESSIKGTFEIEVPLLDGASKVQNIRVYAHMEETVGDSTYRTAGNVLLATNLEGSDLEEAEITGGEFVALTEDLRYGDIGVDGTTMSAIYDPETRIVTFTYSADQNTSEVSAPLAITINYETVITTDLNLNSLVVKFDNQNQIITTNKDNLNMYEYFNKKFFRLIKGWNDLHLKTDGGTCKLTLHCEFLRKAGR